MSVDVKLETEDHRGAAWFITRRVWLHDSDFYQKACDRLREVSLELQAALPFETKIMRTENLFNNHNGVDHGGRHLVVTQDVTVGRFSRKAGDALCKKAEAFDGRRKCGLQEMWDDEGKVSHAECLSCLDRAKVLAGKKG